MNRVVTVIETQDMNIKATLCLQIDSLTEFTVQRMFAEAENKRVLLLHPNP